MKIRQLLLCTLILGVNFTLIAKGSKDNSHFLTIDEVVNSYNLLPPPPVEGSAAFEYDKNQYEWGKSLRDTERGALATADAEISDLAGLCKGFSEAYGMKISEETTPELFALLAQMKEDAGSHATYHAKRTYMRKRPFAYYNENTCNLKQQQELSTNGSYPSGHTAIGWACALVLAEINVEHQEAILKRGYEMGISRIICGFHWQSDVEAGRTVGAAVVARLHAKEAFNKQLAKAKKEYHKLSK